MRLGGCLPLPQDPPQSLPPHAPPGPLADDGPRDGKLRVGGDMSCGGTAASGPRLVEGPGPGPGPKPEPRSVQALGPRSARGGGPPAAAAAAATTAAEARDANPSGPGGSAGLLKSRWNSLLNCTFTLLRRDNSAWIVQHPS